MKKYVLICILTISLIFSSCAVSSYACIGETVIDDHITKETVKLSTLTDDELFKIYLDNGGIITNYYSPRWIRAVITVLEEDPDFDLSLRYDEDLPHVNHIKDCLLYYCINGVPADYFDSDKIEVNSLSYTLQDSEFYANPVEGEEYNCYAYAINYINSWMTPGSASGQAVDNNSLATMTNYELALITADDLNEMGKACVKVTSVCPSYSELSSSQTAICTRVGTKDNGSGYDYHYMKLFSGNVWRHKVGKSAILTYKYTPSSSRDWTNEAVYDGVVYSPTTTYSGTIYYIIYQTNHTYVDSYTGVEYHKGTSHYYEYGDVCTGCGDIQNTYVVSVECGGPPCTLNRELIIP